MKKFPKPMTLEGLQKKVKEPSWAKFKKFHLAMKKKYGEFWLDDLYRSELPKEVWDAYYSATQVVDYALNPGDTRIPNSLARCYWRAYTWDYNHEAICHESN